MSTSSSRSASGRPSSTVTSRSRPSRSAFSRATSAASGERSDAGHPQVGALVEQGQGDGPGPGPDLVDAGALGQLVRRLDQEAGLAARNQHPRVDRDLDPAEALAAEDVGQRLVLGAAGDAGLDRLRDLRASPRRSRPSEIASTSIPSASATRASASARGSSQPAAAIFSAAASTTASTVATGAPLPACLHWSHACAPPRFGSSRSRSRHCIQAAGRGCEVAVAPTRERVP